MLEKILAELTRVLVNEQPGLPADSIFIIPESTGYGLRLNVNSPDDVNAWAKYLEQEVQVLGPLGAGIRGHLHEVYAARNGVGWNVACWVPTDDTEVAS